MKTLIIKSTERAKDIAEAVRKNNGYCPCIVERTEDTKCMCKVFREQQTPGKCLCGRYEKVEAEVSSELAETYGIEVDVHSGNGVKLDQGKPRWELLPYQELEEVVRVLTFGATKYAPNNWQKVEDGKNRYFGACLRHLIAWKNGEKIDKESKLSHLGHAICCILFMLWFDKETPEEVKEGK